MAKIIIEIDDKVLGRIFHRDCIGEEHDCEVTRAIINGIELPDNATNGDIIKALWNVTKIDDTYRMTTFLDIEDDECSMTVWKKWWHSPYKVGDTEE